MVLALRMRVLLFLFLSLIQARAFSAPLFDIYETSEVSRLPCRDQLFRSALAGVDSASTANRQAFFGTANELSILLESSGATPEDADYIQNFVMGILQGSPSLIPGTKYLSQWYRALKRAPGDIPAPSRLIFCLLSPDGTTSSAQTCHAVVPVPGVAAIVSTGIGDLDANVYIVNILSGLEAFAAEQTIIEWARAGKELQQVGDEPDEFWAQIMTVNDDQIEFDSPILPLLIQMTAEAFSLSLDQTINGRDLARLAQNKLHLNQIFAESYTELPPETRAYFELLGANPTNYSDRAIELRRTIHQTIQRAAALTN